MGYDYIIRVAINYKDGSFHNNIYYDCHKLVKAYRKLKREDKDFYIHFATDGHGGSRSLSCGIAGDHLKTLFKFTSLFPDIIFTFYTHYFDFEGVQILVVKNQTVINDNSINLDHNHIDLAELEKYGLLFVENVKSKIEEEGSDEEDNNSDNDNVRIVEKYLYGDPRNIEINNEISCIFYNKKEGMVGGICFGPVFGMSVGEWLFAQ
jgi:hypothetical protein